MLWQAASENATTKLPKHLASHLNFEIWLKPHRPDVPSAPDNHCKNNFYRKSKPVQACDWRVGQTWLAVVANMPGGVPSTPTPFSYSESALLPFTRQILFTQPGLVDCLQEIICISPHLHPGWPGILWVSSQLGAAVGWRTPVDLTGKDQIVRSLCIAPISKRKAVKKARTRGGLVIRATLQRLCFCCITDPKLTTRHRRRHWAIRAHARAGPWDQLRGQAGYQWKQAGVRSDDVAMTTGRLSVQPGFSIFRHAAGNIQTVWVFNLLSGRKQAAVSHGIMGWGLGVRVWGCVLGCVGASACVWGWVRVKDVCLCLRGGFKVRHQLKLCFRGQIWEWERCYFLLFFLLPSRSRKGQLQRHERDKQTD